MVKETEKKKMMIQDTITKTIIFSKCCYEIFKKAKELSILCAMIAIIIFSSTGKAYTFENPSVKTIIHKSFNYFVTSKAYASNGEDGFEEETRLSELYKQYFDLVAQVEVEKKRGEELKQRRRNYPDITKMNKDELLKHKASLEDFKQFLDHEILSKKHMSPSSMRGATSSFEF